MRAVLRQISIDNELVTTLDVTLFPAAAGECAGITGLAGPVTYLPFGADDVKIEIRVRIGPLDLRDRTREPHRLIAVELSRKRMVRGGRAARPPNRSVPPRR